MMPALGRTSSTCSTSSSISSSKSVSFDVEHTEIYYTHAANEYDRSCAKEEEELHAALGKIYLSEAEHHDIEQPQDVIVERNTFANGRRNFQGYAVVLNIRSQKSTHH